MPSPTIEEAARYVSGDVDVWSGMLTNFGKLAVRTDSEECRRANYIKEILQDYAQRNKARPFCIGVFGPPGSGKSTLVKAILQDLSASYSPAIEINMTEECLDSGFRITLVPDGKTPVIFFDEFDTSVDGRRVAWLQKFLPLMQDGKLSGAYPLTKALLVFAGGTADTFDEFVDQLRHNLEQYKSFKVPDFVSRLHAYINIEGINGDSDDRLVRRALALRYQISNRGMESPISIDHELLSELLGPTHFIHNQRSLQSLIDMCLLSGKSEFNKSCLPMGGRNELQPLLRGHVSRGPYDRNLICLSTWQQDTSVHTFAVGLSRELLSKGATIAFGGDLEYLVESKGGSKMPQDGMLLRLIKEAQGLDEGLLKRGEEPALVNYLAYPSNLRTQEDDMLVQDHIDEVKRAHPTLIHFVDEQTISAYELRLLGLGSEYFRSDENVKTKVAWAISLFRMRQRMIQDAEALIVFGGKSSLGESENPTGPAWGRCSGIAEEVYLAVTAKKPVYIICNGAGALVGHLLGLGSRRWSKPLESPSVDGFNDELKRFEECFRLPGQDELVVTQEELLAGLSKFGIDALNNGLSRDENIELFNLRPFCATRGADDSRKAIELINRGLRRVIQPYLT